MEVSVLWACNIEAFQLTLRKIILWAKRNFVEIRFLLESEIDTSNVERELFYSNFDLTFCNAKSYTNIKEECLLTYVGASYYRKRTDGLVTKYTRQLRVEIDYRK